MGKSRHRIDALSRLAVDATTTTCFGCAPLRTRSCVARERWSPATSRWTPGHPLRTQRLAKRLARQNLRVLISGTGSIDPDAAIFKPKLTNPCFCLPAAPAKRLAKLKNVADEVIVYGAKSVALGQALGRLRRDWNKTPPLRRRRVLNLSCSGLAL